MRFFVEYVKGYDDVFDNVRSVYIKKVNNKNHIEIEYINKTTKDLLPLNEIRLCFLIDVNTMHEYFRYQK